MTAQMDEVLQKSILGKQFFILLVKLLLQCLILRKMQQERNNEARHQFFMLNIGAVDFFREFDL